MTDYIAIAAAVQRRPPQLSRAWRPAHRGGFTDDDILKLTTLPACGLARSSRRSSSATSPSTLLNTYVGSQTGHQILQGPDPARRRRR